MPCDLDTGPQVGPVYGDTDPDFWAGTCRTCRVPLLATWQCSMDTPADVLRRMRARAEDIGRQVYGQGKFRIDEGQRQIAFHRHIHVRPI